MYKHSIMISLVCLLLSSCGDAFIVHLDIHEAVESGSISGVRQALLINGNINKIKSRQSALCKAVWRNDTEMVKFLLDQGADVNAGSSQPLRAAVGRNNQEMIDFLIGQNAYADQAIVDSAYQGDQQLTTLLLENGTFGFLTMQEVLNQSLTAAAQGNKKEMVDFLIEKGAEIKQPLDPLFEDSYLSGIRMLAEEIENPVQAAANQGHLEMVKYLHKKGTALTGVFKGALVSNNLEIALYAIEHGLDVRAEKERYSYLLLNAAMNENPEFLKLLIENGIGVNEHHIRERSALYVAGRSLNVKTFTLLLENGAELFETEDFNRIIHDALMDGKVEIIKVLIQYKVKEIIKPYHISDGIYSAVTNGYLDQLKYMVVLGGDLSIIYPQGENTVLMAVQNARENVLNYLVEQGVDLNHQRPDGTTPLMSAVIYGDTDIAKMLLEHGADLTLKDTFGKSANDYAKEESDVEMIKLLQSYAK